MLHPQVNTRDENISPLTRVEQCYASILCGPLLPPICLVGRVWVLTTVWTARRVGCMIAMVTTLCKRTLTCNKDSINTHSGLDINLLWDLSCHTSDGSFQLSEMKIHLPPSAHIFCLILNGRIFCSYNCFQHKHDKRELKFLLVSSDKWSEKFSCLTVTLNCPWQSDNP